MIKACMFDLDGTLCNTLASIASFANAALKAYGLKEHDVQKYRMMVGNGRDKLIERMIIASTGEMNDDLFDKVGTLYDRLYGENPLNLVAPYDGIPKMLKTLKANGIKTAVISNKPDDMTRLVVAGILGNENFDLVRGSLPEFPKKPDPTSPLDILDRLGVSPDECLYIGDSGVDMQTGKNANMTTVGCAWGFRGSEELKENGADYIVNSAEEILAVLEEKNKN